MHKLEYAQKDAREWGIKMIKTLMYMEVKKNPLKFHFVGLLAANFIIFLLSIFTSSILTISEDIFVLTGLPSVQLDTITLATMLIRAMLIVWEAVLISIFIIEEYRNKTIGLLFTYPVSRKKLIIAKLFLICGTILIFNILSSIFQYVCIFFVSKYLSFVTFSFMDIGIQMVIMISSILLGLLPLYIGMIKKSTIATIVSSVVLVAIAVNSQGSNAGLMSIPIVAIIFASIGVIFSAITINKMISSDLSN